MEKLIKIDIPAGRERDEFLRKLASIKGKHERQDFVQKVVDLYEPESTEVTP